MREFTKHLIIGALCLALISTADAGFAQTTTGSIVGRVTGLGGVRLNGVIVTARNLDTEIPYPKTSEAGGLFSIPGLRIGKYQVTFVYAGFDPITRNVEVTLDHAADLGEIKLGLSPTKLTITDDPTSLNTTNSQVGARLPGLGLRNLPISGGGGGGGGLREVFGPSYSSTTGVAVNSPGLFTGVLGSKGAVNGHGFRDDYTVVDGISINDPTSGGRALLMNNADVVQDVQIITNQYAAENGGASGAIVSLATMGGTKDWHGSLFWFNNSNHFNSLNNVDKASGLKQAPFRIENQFGGTLGGPIVRKNTFVFASTQHWTDRNRNTGSTISAPTDEGRQLLLANGGTRVTTKALLESLPAAQTRTGDVRYCFSDTFWNVKNVPPPGVTKDPSNPGQFFCGSSPTPGWTVITIPVGSVTNSSLIRYNDWQGSIRIDNKLSDRHSLNGRYIFNNDRQTGAGQATPTGLTNITTTRSQLASIGMTSTLTERFFNEVRVGFSRYAFTTGPQFPAALNIPSIEINDLGLTGSTSVGPRSAIGYAANLPEGRRNNVYQLVDNMMWSHGRHTSKWGVDIRKQQLASDFTSNSVRGVLVYSSLTNFVADYANTRAAINRPLPGGQGQVHFSWTDLAFFTQDDWKVTPTLTLNLGLRYELPGNPIESLYPVNDRIVAANGNDPLFRYTSRPPRDINNLMPRLGFNWNLGDKAAGLLHGVILRGGYARTNSYAALIMALQMTLGFPFQQAFTAGGTPGTMENLSTIANQTLTSDQAAKLSQTVFLPDFHTPYSDQYSLEVQRTVGENNLLRFGYVGTKGTGLFQSLEGNPITRCGSSDCPRVDPTRGVVRARANTGSSIYHSLQVNFDHYSPSGFGGGVHFTESTYIDNGSEVVNPSVSEVATPQDPFNRNAGERARSTFDRPHQITGNLVYEFPFLKDRRDFAGVVGSGLQVGTLLVIQSGAPFTVLNGGDPGNVLKDSLTGSAIRPNFAPGVNIDELRKMSVSEIRRRVIEAGSPSLFFRSPTAVDPIGNVPRNFLRSDGLVSIDVNIVKNVRLGSGHTLQFRADVFNLPNTRNFSIPKATASGTAFDFLNQGAADAGNRRVFLSARYSF